MAGVSQRRAYGGKTIHGARIGMVMVDTVFPRMPGDFGNMLTWPFPVLAKVVRGFNPTKVTTFSAEEMMEPFALAAEELVAEGVDGITSSCGFLSLVQGELRRRCGVPVAVSALMQVPFIERLLPPGKRVGVLTVSSQLLEERHLVAAGAAADSPLAGCEMGS